MIHLKKCKDKKWYSSGSTRVNRNGCIASSHPKTDENGFQTPFVHHETRPSAEKPRAGLPLRRLCKGTVRTLLQKIGRTGELCKAARLSTVYLATAALLCMPCLATMALPDKSREKPVKEIPAPEKAEMTQNSPGVGYNHLYSGIDVMLKKYAPVSPQAAALIQKVNYPVDYSIGAANVSVPLYTIKTRDFELPLSLSCITTGIKLSDRNGWIATGWTLNAEPMITRKIRGLPDNDPTSGYIHDLSDFDTTDPSDIKDALNGGRDELPDIFYFSTLSNSGKFVLKRPEEASEKGKYHPILIPCSAEKITAKNEDITNSGFQLNDDRGYIYQFGDRTTARETTQYNSINQVSGWKPTTITSPRGEELQFKYESYSYTDVAFYDYYRVDDNYNGGPTPGLPTSGYMKSVSWNNGLTGPSLTHHFGNDEKQELIKEFLDFKEYPFLATASSIGAQVIREIRFPTGSVLFFYKSRDGDTPCLDWIDIYEGSKLLQQIKFGYEQSYTIRPNYKPIWNLKTLTFEDKITNKSRVYKFDYYPSPDANQITTKAIDFWGYYNGQGGNKDLVPFQIVDYSKSIYATNFKLYIGTANRQPNANYAKTASLSKIHHPGGSITSFTYEMNKYYNTEESDVKEGGGLRIASITHSDQNGDETRSFTYEGEYGRGWGHIVNPPYLNFFVKKEDKLAYLGTNGAGMHSTELKSRTYGSQSILDIFATNRTPVYYHTVYETIKTHVKTTRIKHSFRFSNLPGFSPTQDSPSLLPEYLNDWKHVRPVSETEYRDGGSEILKTTNTEYTDFTLAETQLEAPYCHRAHDRVIEMYDSGTFPYDKMRHTKESGKYTGGQQLLPTKITTTEYIKTTTQDTDSFKTSVSMDYSPSNPEHLKTKLPYKTTTANSDGTVYSKIVAYPFRFPSGNTDHDDAVSAMMRRNDLTTPLEISYFRGDMSKTLRSLYTVNTGSTVPYALAKTQESIGYGTFADIEEFTRFDKKGNPVEYIRRDGVTVALLWGYNYTLLIAECVGSTFQGVMTQIGPDTNYDLMQQYGSGALTTLLKKLGSGTTTYLYDPTRGVTTITPPNKAATTYTYDGWGRLLNIKDDNGKLREQYNYNIINPQ